MRKAVIYAVRDIRNGMRSIRGTIEGITLSD